jgi:NADH-quinone oxidoreductase subunit E
VATTTHEIDGILKDFSGSKRDSLIPLLQKVQEIQGYLSRDAVAKIARHLNLPSSKIYGVATFYNMFRFQPKGRNHIQICRGTACHVKGSKKVLETVQTALGIEPGKTTRDRMFSLEVVACMGACALSPAININGEFHAKVTPARILKLIDQCRQCAAAPTDGEAEAVTASSRARK